MKGRCINPNYIPYPYYGGKGIKVCSEWMDFMNFYNWSINNGYSDELSIDRIDPSGDYCPGNCRWATKFEQSVHLTKPIPPSGYYGVCKHGNSKSYYGRVKNNKKVIYTGSAQTALEAAMMRDQYIIEHNLKNRLNGVI